MNPILPVYWVPALLVFGSLLLIRPWVSPENPLVRRGIIWLFTSLTIRYHYWRITSTLPLFENTLKSLVSYGFYGLECASAFVLLRNRQLLAKTSNRTPDVERNLRWYGTGLQSPLVDVLIPTYNENQEILERTILAARNLRHPRVRVWVLDDGRREWLRAMCGSLGVNYASRPDNTHFKAGNLNNGLRQIYAQAEQPSYLAVLDADFVVFPNFLERTLALMNDRSIAIVQTPQQFCNPDPFQYAFDAQDAWPDDQRSWFEFRLPSLDAQANPTCCGTSFLVRFAAVEQIGGFPTESICEDTLLSIKLRTLGLRTVYLGEGLSVGLSPEGLGEFLLQRARWCIGGMQIVRYRWQLLGRALELRKRLRLIEGVLHSVLPRVLSLVWFVVPIVYWVTGFAILRARGQDVVSYAMPLWANRMALSWVSRGALMPIVTDAANLLTTPLYLQAAFRGLSGSRNYRFNVTPKGINRRTVLVHWSTLSWIAALGVALLGALAYRAMHPQLSLRSSRFLLWNLYSSYQLLLVLCVAAAPCIEMPKHRTTERYRSSRTINLRRASGSFRLALEDISVGGALVSGCPELQIGEQVVVDVLDELSLEARVVRKKDGSSSGLAFQPTTQQKAQLIDLILCSGEFVPSPRSWSFLRCARAMLRRALATA